MVLRWSKKLSRTDAQQPTGGYPVPYLRFTCSGSPHDTQFWFRDVFFSSLVWRNSVFGQHPVEEADVAVEVTIHANNMGIRQMTLTYDAGRRANNNTPTTYLHYDPQTVNDLRNNNFTDDWVVLERTPQGHFHLSIQAVAPKPKHSP